MNMEESEAIQKLIREGDLISEMVAPSDSLDIDEGLLDVKELAGEPVTFDELYEYMGMEMVMENIYVVTYRHMDARRSVSAAVIECKTAVTPDVMPELIAPVSYDVYKTVSPQNFGEGDYSDLTEGLVREAVRRTVKMNGHDYEKEEWYGRIIM